MLGTLLVATAAMTALHRVQPAIDPVEQPVSFYAHGAHGWLLSLALGALGLASLLLWRVLRPSLPAAARRSLGWAGAGIAVTAIVPSDRWFPWENDPSFPGAIHALLAMIAPVILLHPMIALAWKRSPPPGGMARGVVLAYGAALLGAAASLAIGFALDRAPPRIGLFERLLIVTATSWVALSAWQVRHGSDRHRLGPRNKA